ncbi:MAG: CysZ protein [Flavobacteriales bacterium]|jgi:CysZ protein
MNSFGQNFKLGISTYFRSFGFIVKNKMMHFYLYPLAFVILFSIGAAAGIGTLNDLITEWVNGYIQIEELPGADVWDKTLNFVKSMATYAINFIVWLSLIIVFHKLNKYLVLIVMSPVMSIISERTDEIITGKKYPFDWRQLIKDVWRGVLIALRNLFFEMSITILLLSLNLAITVFLPFLSIITTPLVAVALFFIGAYYYGFSTMDYTNERYRLSTGESVRYIRKNKGLAVSNGSIFALWLAIPVLGTYVGTVFAPVTCTVGATLSMLAKGDLSPKSKERVTK